MNESDATPYQNREAVLDGLSPSQNSKPASVPLLSLIASESSTSHRQQVTTARGRARTREEVLAEMVKLDAETLRSVAGESLPVPVMSWADFVGFSHGVLAAYIASRGDRPVEWADLDSLGRRRWLQVLGALERHLSDRDTACAAYEEVRQHERDDARPALPWGALDAAAREPWVFAAALVAGWRRGL